MNASCLQATNLYRMFVFLVLCQPYWSDETRGEQQCICGCFSPRRHPECGVIHGGFLWDIVQFDGNQDCVIESLFMHISCGVSNFCKSRFYSWSGHCRTTFACLSSFLFMRAVSHALEENFAIESAFIKNWQKWRACCLVQIAVVTLKSQHLTSVPMGRNLRGSLVSSEGWHVSHAGLLVSLLLSSSFDVVSPCVPGF